MAGDFERELVFFLSLEAIPYSFVLGKKKLVYRGGGTQVMTGWNKVKEAHFRKHGGDGKAWKDPTYGWQATKKMAKLSLLVMLGAF